MRVAIDPLGNPHRLPGRDLWPNRTPSKHSSRSKDPGPTGRQRFFSATSLKSCLLIRHSYAWLRRTPFAFRFPCEKIRGFWPRNRILARNPPASEEKDILLQQKPRSAKSMPVKMWQIVPECGLVAIFGPILATEPRSGTDRPPQERVRKSRPGLLSEIPFTRLPNLAFSCQNAVSWPKIAITPTWKGVQREKSEEGERGEGRNASTTTSRPTI